MAASYISSKNSITARAELSASDVGAAFAAVAFTNESGDSVTVFNTGGRMRNLYVLGLAAAQDADVKVQIRNTVGDSWLDAAVEVALTAGTVAEVFDAPISAAQFQIVAKDTLTAGASVDLSFHLSEV